MTEILDFLTRFLPVEIAIIAVIFIYLLILFKGIAEKFISLAEKQTTLAETQTHYIQDRLDVVEKFLGISDKAIELRDKHIQELERMANQREADTIKTQKALDEAQERLKLMEQRHNEVLSSSNLQSKQVDTIKEVQSNLQQATFELATKKIVHELQIRLQVVISLSENLALEVNTLESKDIGERANDILNSVLALSTVVGNLGQNSEYYSFRKEKIDSLLREAIQIFQTEAKERNIEFRIKLDESPQIEISHYHLQLAINNLIHNAIKYSFAGNTDRSRVVEITGHNEQDHYVFSISNYGIGIKNEEIVKGLIFQDGYQGELTRGEHRTGSGMGLTVAKRVIDRHKGKIEVESKPVGEKNELKIGQPYLNKISVSLPINQKS